MDGSKTNEVTGEGLCGCGTRKGVSVCLKQYTTLLKAEVYNIKACEVENINRGNKNMNIFILLWEE
jgi:hypothetical protein